MKMLRGEMFWGVAVLALVGALTLTAAVVYVRPPGQRTVSFLTDDAAAVKPGDGVRIAGITIGKVESLAIEQNQVRVRASVDDDAFVGDQSQIQVRMLTVVGGYYVNLVSLGDKPLGSEAIPIERVTMPYNLMKTLADSTKITERINAKPIRESLDQIQAGLNGTNVDTLTAAIDAGRALTSTIDRQRGQISQILNLSDEYIESLANYRGKLRELVEKISVFEQTLVLYGKGFAGALGGMGDIGEAFLEPFGKFWVNHREEFIQRVREWQNRVRRWVDNNSRLVPRLRSVRNKIERVLDAQNARPELLATDLCIPMPGSPC
ncbi:Mce family protein [Mycobacteroides abscessus subsp. abscessus]|uniref:Mce family protein n=2 Tax=Mycobacteroides abscessus TaxID=36809 RepID=A0A9Q7SGX6_9MYCO|nr:MlaD family protein [Mycobacteroides abscessus]EHM20712.1 Mce family protein [Mycobacteroides abscessus subsp. massiliense CCUG 48898 = JCM 15300]EHM22051.1 Mce family protein [Mycobacteroides abscessus subsp. bolletii BD]EIV67459.1 MCE-family protein Mce6C [Mycobacteroides abscessus subsp. massiliense CCUG 48898 = JCM 15300]MBL3748613.1 MCE family protein [Mycobacteroides abscessus subsp. massiliense]MBN7315290.1 MCE family protein [Mycobacteroides abscessus subsp. massiliense]